MRSEALWLLLVGAPVFVVVYFASRAFKSETLRTLSLALCFGLTLGLGVVPGHGELVVAPVLAFLHKGGLLAAVGVVYGLLWSVVFFLSTRALAKHHSRRAQ